MTNFIWWRYRKYSTVLIMLKFSDKAENINEQYTIYKAKLNKGNAISSFAYINTQ